MRCGTTNDIGAISRTDPGPRSHQAEAAVNFADRCRGSGRVLSYRDQQLVDPPPVEVDHLEPQITLAHEPVAHLGHATELPQDEPGKGLVVAVCREVAPAQQALEAMDLDPAVDQPRAVGAAARVWAARLVAVAGSSPAIAVSRSAGVTMPSTAPYSSSTTAMTDAGLAKQLDQPYHGRTLGHHQRRLGQGG